MRSSEAYEKLPRHIGIIMDGNGRWAQRRLLPRKAGHKKGVDTISVVADEVFACGVSCLSLFAFSTENRQRPKEEVDALLALMEEYFDSSFKKFVDDGVRITTMGDLSFFPASLQNKIRRAKEESAAFTEKTINFALNYGGRDEIIMAANKAVKEGKALNEDTFLKLLYTSDLPPLDALVRTGGEKRLSNFMLYQTAYSELFFTDTLWPDFNKKSLHTILEDYAKRNRRFGKIKG